MEKSISTEFLCLASCACAAGSALGGSPPNGGPRTPKYEPIRALQSYLHGSRGYGLYTYNWAGPASKKRQPEYDHQDVSKLGQVCFLSLQARTPYPPSLGTIGG